jgi:hypothetical protein
MWCFFIWTEESNQEVFFSGQFASLVTLNVKVEKSDKSPGVQNLGKVIDMLSLELRFKWHTEYDDSNLFQILSCKLNEERVSFISFKYLLRPRNVATSLIKEAGVLLSCFFPFSFSFQWKSKESIL